jgi:hypothetical protein
MLASVPTLSLSRVAAVFVAIALTGAPRLVTASRPKGAAHRCQCASHKEHHECACPACRSARTDARAHNEQKLAACQRRAKAQAAERERSDAPASRPACVRSSCGTPEEPARSASAGIDLFTLPAALCLTLLPLLERASMVQSVLQNATPDPETPPPRTA